MRVSREEIPSGLKEPPSSPASVPPSPLSTACVRARTHTVCHSMLPEGPALATIAVFYGHRLVLTSWPNTALHSGVPADSARPQTTVLPAGPGPRATMLLPPPGWVPHSWYLLLEVHFLSEASPVLQPRTGPPHPLLWHSAMGGALVILLGTGPRCPRVLLLGWREDDFQKEYLSKVNFRPSSSFPSFHSSGS